MARLDVREIMEREAKAQSRKDQWRTIYEDCYEFALPQRNMYDGNYEGNTAGQKKMGRVFDSTAISATQRFANRIQAGLFPPQKAMVSPRGWHWHSKRTTATGSSCA